MPYRALTHGRVNSYVNKTKETHSQKSAKNSESGVANNGPPVVQKNKLNIPTGNNGKARPIYARTLMRDLLIPPNTFGNDNNYAPNQGKGFPTANPQTSVGGTNIFCRRAIKKKAETKTFLNKKETKNCSCI